MRFHRELALAAAALSLAACETVSSPVPLGEKPAVIEAAKWEGRWFNAEGYLDVTVVDAANGLVRIAYQGDEDCEEVAFELRTAGDWMFINVTEEDFERSEGLASSPCTPVKRADDALGEGDDSAPRSYLWARIRHSDDTVITWRPDAAAFVSLVEQGLIPGTVDEGSVVLGPLCAEHYRIITSGSHGVVLDWEHPMVLYRLKPGEGPE